MKRLASFALPTIGAIGMVVTTYVILRPSGLERTVELFRNFFAR